MTPPARPLNVTLRGDGCLLYSKEEQVRHSYKAIPVMSEGTVMALFLRQKMTPKLPMALVSDAAAVSFEHALYVDADVMVLNPSFASDLLQNSLRLHDMA